MKHKLTVLFFLALYATPLFAQLPPVFNQVQYSSDTINIDHNVTILAKTSNGNFAKFSVKYVHGVYQFDGLIVYRPNGDVLFDKRDLALSLPLYQNGFDLDTGVQCYRNNLSCDFDGDTMSHIRPNASFTSYSLHPRNNAQFSFYSESGVIIKPKPNVEQPKNWPNNNNTVQPPYQPKGNTVVIPKGWAPLPADINTGTIQVVVQGAQSTMMPGTYSAVSLMGLYDDQKNGVVYAKNDPRWQGGDRQYIFPRQQIYIYLHGGEIKRGASFPSGANIVVYCFVKTWSTVNRWQFVAIHLYVDANEVVRPILMVVGDLNTVEPVVGGTSQGIVMFTDQVSLTLDNQSRLPTSSGPGFIKGKVTGYPKQVASDAPAGSTGTVYMAYIDFTFCSKLEFNRP